MRRRAGSVARVRVAALVAVLGAAGCGVRAQEAPDRLPVSVVPTEAGVVRPVVASVYFVRAGAAAGGGAVGGRVVPVRRLVVAPGAPHQRLGALAAGADDPGLRTYVPAGVAVTVREGVAEVTVPDAFARAPRDERMLAAAQVVFTLTEGGDVAVVRFTAGRRPVAVPRPGGTPTTAPLTRADYATLAA